MLDLKFLREHPDRVRQALLQRGVSFDLDGFLRKDELCRKKTVELEDLRHRKRIASEEVAQLKRQGKNADRHLANLRTESEGERDFSAEVAKIQAQIEQAALLIPNLPHASVPVGPDAKSNRILRAWGEPRKFSFQPRNHLELAGFLRLMDFERAAKISGSHFALFTGSGARLERALIQFMLDLHTREHGYQEISTPFLVNRAAMIGTGQLPKFEEDLYRLKDDDLFLIPTAEVPVTNLLAGEVLEASTLPRYYTAYTPCFRREAGSYGKETKGLTRIHQFDKVELVKLTLPERSYEEMESLTANAEKILQLLELPYRVVALSTGDLGFASAKTYDLEAFSAGTGGWLEVSSCSNFEEFQARRANIRYRDPATRKLRYVHTLNGSGVALARTVIALLEHHQNQDGSVTLPAALRPYLDGLERLVSPL